MSNIVDIESPYGSADPDTRERNRRYARALMAWALGRGHTPFASHLLYTQPGILDDADEAQRMHGIMSGKRIMEAAGCEMVIVGEDLGVSPGMALGVHWHRERGHRVISILLGDGWDHDGLSDAAWRER